MGRISWTELEVNTLKELYPEAPLSEILNALKHSRGAIYTKAHKMGIKRKIREKPKKGYKFTEEQVQRLIRSHTKWTEEQENLLRKLYPRTKSKDLELVFPNFTATQIAFRANQIGSRKDYSFFVSTGMEGSAAKWAKENPNDGMPPRGKKWKYARRLARHRAQYKCEWCGVKEIILNYRLSVHHIIPFRVFDYVYLENKNDEIANRQSNLVALCRSCHTSAEVVDVKNRKELLEYFNENPREKINNE